jgi:hypothetical protein
VQHAHTARGQGWIWLHNHLTVLSIYGKDFQPVGENMREIGDPGAEGVLSVTGKEYRYPEAEMARYLGVTTPTVNRLATLDQSRALLKYS